MKIYADDRLAKNQNISYKVVFVGKNVKREIVYTFAVAAFFVMFCNEFEQHFYRLMFSLSNFYLKLFLLV